MTSTSDKENEDRGRLIIIDHCPNQWQWATYHAEGKLVSFGYGDNKKITLGHDSKTTIIQYIHWGFFLPYDTPNRFARIIIPKDEMSYIGYFNPCKRRAVFFYGKTEPSGLLMFFIWHSLFDQKTYNLLDFFKTCLDYKNEMGKIEGVATLDFEDFLRIRDLIGNNLSLSELHDVGNFLVDSYRKRIKKIYDEHICTHEGRCSCDEDNTHQYRKNVKLMDPYLKAMVDCTSVSQYLKLILELKLASKFS